MSCAETFAGSPTLKPSPIGNIARDFTRAKRPKGAGTMSSLDRNEGVNVNSPVRLVIVALVFVVSYAFSPQVSAVMAALFAAWLYIRLRQRPDDEVPKPAPAETLERAASTLDSAQIRGDMIRTTIDDRAVNVQLTYVPSGGLRIPVYRMRMIVNRPIPFCFTVRRKGSQLPFERLVRNTELDSPPFEYELKKVPIDHVLLAERFECAANFVNLMQRLLLQELMAVLLEAEQAHDTRFEEISYDGFRVTALIQPVQDPAQDPNLQASLAFFDEIRTAIERFVQAEDLEESVKSA